MTSLGSMFERSFISSVDFAEYDKDVVVTIASAGAERIKNPQTGDEERKPVLKLTAPISEDGPRTMVLNRINVRRLKEALGTDEPEALKGRSIALYKTKVPFGAEEKDGVRIRGTAPAVGVTPVAAHVLEDGDEVPF